MDKYIPMYRCQLCGEKIAIGSPAEVPYNKLPELLAQVVKQQRFQGTALCHAPMHIVHKCADRSCGLAAFAGFGKLD